MAQDVKEVVPNAVSLINEYVPDELRAISNPVWTEEGDKWRLTIDDLAFSDNHTKMCRLCLGKTNKFTDLKVEEDKVPKKEEFHTENIKYGESKKCPYCAEDINIAAIKCKHCGEIFDKEKISRNTYDVASAVLRNQGTPKDQRHTRTVVVRENNNGCLTFLVLLILIFIVLYFFVGPLIFWGKLISFTQSL